MDVITKTHETMGNFTAAQAMVDRILEDPNHRGYLIDLVFLVFEREGVVSHPQDLLALLMKEGE